MSVRLISPLVAVVSLASVSGAFAQFRGSVEVNRVVHHDVSRPIRNIAPRPPRPDKHSKPNHHVGHKPASAQRDGARQAVAGTTSAPATAQTWDGIGNGFWGTQGSFSVSAAPSDSNGAVGTTQYVQWVNESFAVFDKATSAVLYGPAPGNTFWYGFGGPCENNNDGDPIAQYDKAADRWVMTQLAVTGGPPYYQCVAVSTSSDATGSYYRYAFEQPYFNDYAKLAVWPDAYYMTFNMYDGNTFLGARACALDRASMLNGAPATQQCQQFLSYVDSLLPSDLDGATPPPAGSPNYLVDFLSNYLRLWKYHVDFVDPANTTMTGPFNMLAAPFSEACLNFGGVCIPQLGTTQLLDSVGDRLMYRLAYRNFGDHEALVVNHSVDTPDAVGVRWYELRNLSGTPTLYQQGTYAPDSNYRWMGSIAMDQSGNIALGYSLSSSAMKPAIAYTGRVPTDPLGTMGTETVVLYGTGSQMPNLNRWGDYSSMSIDPVDDCTFWYTNQYLQADGTFNWSTQIANFRFPSCGVPVTPDFSVSAIPASSAATQGSNTSYTVSVSAAGGFTGNVDLSLSGLPAGAGYSFSPTPVAASGNSTLTITTASSTPTGTYTLTITGTSGSLVHSATVTLTVTALPVDFTLTATPGSQTIAQGSMTNYTVSVSSVNGFTGTVDLSLSGLPAGAGYSFNPTPIAGSGNSTLTITTNSVLTPAGTYYLTITGTSGSLVHTATIILTVTALPDFTLTASPASQTATQGSNTSYTVSVSSIGGFTGNVALSLSGLPGGAGYSFNPTSIAGSGNSTLTITTSSSTATGTYTLTITGTSFPLSHSTSVTMVVIAAPDFSVGATPSSNSVIQGSGANYTVTVAASNGFTGNVGLTLGNLPAGAGYTFSPSSVAGSGTSTLSITTDSSTPAGTYSLTITGTSGTLSHSIGVTLVVNPAAAPDFSVTATPANRTVWAGSSARYYVTVTPNNGFNGTVNLSVSGLAAGTSASFNPASVNGSGTSVLRVHTSGSTAPGTYTLTITGTSGALSHATAVTLTVQ
jgi:uncharacterized membrane protein